MTHLQTDLDQGYHAPNGRFYTFEEIALIAEMEITCLGNILWVEQIFKTDDGYLYVKEYEEFYLCITGHGATVAEDGLVETFVYTEKGAKNIIREWWYKSNNYGHNRGDYWYNVWVAPSWEF